MNYLAHLYLAKPTANSYFGNLLGDFRKGVNIEPLPEPVKKGLKNHYLVDKFTDHHPLIKQGRQLFSADKRRFSGVAMDVLFDYFLIKHWSEFSTLEFIPFKQHSYQLLAQKHPLMPDRMKSVTQHMIRQDWLMAYSNLSGVANALDNIAARIRFQNNFGGSIDDIQAHYPRFEAIFLAFFPALIEHVKAHDLEG